MRNSHHSTKITGEFDPVPTWLLKRVAHIIANVIAIMCNASFQQQSLPISHKTSLLRPLLKKTTLDPADVRSYRPISNFSFVSNVLERFVDARLNEHIVKHHLFPVFQSAYRSYDSAETAKVSLHHDMIDAMD
jgi:hypothetical protein